MHSLAWTHIGPSAPRAVEAVARQGANAVGANHKRDNERQMPRRAGIANARTYSTLNEAYQKIRDGGDGPQLDMMRGVMRLSNAALR